MYEAFREAPQSKKDRSRLKLGLWITLAAVLLALTATPLVWASRQSAAYRRYMDALNGSVLYAREHDGVWLERAGSRVHYPQLAGAGIITNPAYWKGGAYSAANVQALIIKMAAAL